MVPWRSMQAQKRELREKEKELAEALVVLAGEVAFTGMYSMYIYLRSQQVGSSKLLGIEYLHRISDGSVVQGLTNTFKIYPPLSKAPSPPLRSSKRAISAPASPAKSAR